MAISLKKAYGHFRTITRHRHEVIRNSKKAGILWQGLFHDLSKYTPAEFMAGARYFCGDRSPNETERAVFGYSAAWLHHKGRNKHHIEYWLDADCAVTPLMPYKYAVECICDKLAATRVYAKAQGVYNNDMPLGHWRRFGNKVNGNPKTMAFIEKVFTDLAHHGEKFVLNKKYMKKTYNEITYND